MAINKQQLKFSSQEITSWLFTLLFFGLPLIFIPYNYEIFEFNKTIFLFIFTLLLLFVWLSASLETKKLLLPRQKWLSGLFFLFLLTQILSTLTSSDKYLSIWGYYSRFNQSLLHSFAYFSLFILYLLWMDQKTTRRVIAGQLLSLALITTYALGQHLGIDANFWVQDVKNRVFSTLGQPNWLASFILLAFFMVAYEYISGYQRVSKYIKILLFSLFLSGIFFSKSRSGYLGLLTSIFVFGLALFYARLSKKLSPAQVRVNFELLGIVSSLTIIFSLFIWNPLHQSHLHLYPYHKKQTSPTLSSRPKNITPSSKIREIVWKGGIKLWRLNLKNTLVGTGVETFAFNYYLTRPKEHNLTSEWDYIYNKAHNEYLNFLVTTGVIGFASYFLLIGGSIFVFWRYFNQYSPTFLAGYLGFLVTNFFGFSVVPTAFLFYLYPAIFLTLLKTKSPNPPLFQLNSVKKIILYLLLLIPILGGVKTTLNWWRADYLFTRGNRYLQAKYYLQASQDLLKAVKLSPYHPLYKVKLAEALSYQAVGYSIKEDQLRSYVATVSSTAIKNKAQTIISQLDFLKTKDINLINSLYQQAIKESPTNLEYQKSRIKSDIILATINPNYYQQAIRTLKQLMIKSPTDPKYPYNLGLVYQMIGNKKLAKKYISLAIKLKPNYLRAINSLKLLQREKVKSKR